ncbi:rod-binding protein [uncultured Helicobacter sp.]|uniref:rod-binding protein n=1 Tax=uncultured Helicobacter sp. TaxID=175537 RepID=UPI001C3B4121|nr:rod-binding protein [Candidatus Helicobacter avicola]
MLQAKEDKKLREQTDNFEALFLQIVLKDAIKNDNPLYPKQPGSDIYHSMYIENLAQNLSGSFGYSELLFNYLKGLQQ